MSEVRSNRAWRLECEALRAERDELLTLRHQFAEENSRLFAERTALLRERDEAVACISNALEALSDGDNAGAHLILYGWSQKATKP